MTVANVVLSAALLWLVACIAIVAVYFRTMQRFWREPVFKHPILIIESDDWGAGPLIQAAALDGIADVLERHRDVTGRSPVLTLAVVLAVPDGEAIQASDEYRRLCLDAPLFEPIVAALRRGQSRGVFVTQLHGLEHFWPEALMASKDPDVQAWLRQSLPPVTEQLPSHLQSRWVNAAVLPSTIHSEQQVREAVAAEVSAYRSILGCAPQVVVPPTFVWTREVEAAWSDQGVECVVTPGVRYTRRNADGAADRTEGPFVNGERAGSVTYVVRTDYFEPARGRDAAYAMRALDRDVALGRPCILENHRDNFCKDDDWRARSQIELDDLLRAALEKHREVRFMSTWELYCVLRDRDPRWLVFKRADRLSCVWERFRRSGRLWKLMRLSGLAAAGARLVRFFGPSARASA